MDNLPTLYINVMDGLRSELGRDAFLWATERQQNDRMCYAAEAFAHEVERIVDTVWPLLRRGFALHGVDSAAKQIDLTVFMLRRHAHWRFPGRNEAWI